MKNNSRLFLYAAAFGVAFILWNKWQMAKQVPIATQQPVVEVGVPSSAPSGQTAGVPTAAAGGAVSVADVPQVQMAQTNPDTLIKVSTDVLTLYINPVGGTIEEADLLHYPVAKDSDEPLALMKSTNPARFLLQSGLQSTVEGQAPTHHALFASAASSYDLGGQDVLQVPLVWQNEQGVRVSKVYEFKRGAYDFDLRQTVDNQSANEWQGFAYQQLVFGEARPRGGIGQVYTFTGGVTSTADDPYNKIKLNDIRKEAYSTTATEGWVAMIQHYFLGALVPKTGDNYRFYTNYASGDHIVGASTQNMAVASGGQLTFATTGYIGPKIQSDLREIAPRLDKTVDYGFLFMIAQPMFKVLIFIYGLIGNWGWAIIIMTILIKLIFFMPSAWAYKSMAKMRRLQPEMTRLKERFGDDRQGMSQAMMKLYKDEKVNPASGCLPMLLQIPFFIAFYWVLVESVELRQAPWLGWVQDLSAMDPLFILPVLNAALMFLQQKLNPPPPDPMQAKVMMMLPLVFGFMFMWFPSGLVLYWTVSNAFSIVQQAVMNKRYGEPRLKEK